MQKTSIIFYIFFLSTTNIIGMKRDHEALGALPEFLDVRAQAPEQRSLMNATYRLTKELYETVPLFKEVKESTHSQEVVVLPLEEKVMRNIILLQKYHVQNRDSKITDYISTLNIGSLAKLIRGLDFVGLEHIAQQSFQVMDDQNCSIPLNPPSVCL